MKRIRSTVFFIAVLAVFAGNTAQAEQAKSNLEVPEEVVWISKELGGEYNICPELIQAICWKESRFQPDAENGGCIGIMQICPKWHKDRMERLKVTDLADTRQNMLVGIDYLAELAEDGEDIAKVLMTYHGESNVDKKLNRGEISSYADDILEISAELERRNGK